MRTSEKKLDHISPSKPCDCVFGVSEELKAADYVICVLFEHESSANLFSWRNYEIACDPIRMSGLSEQGK
jgi:hypothetical protein